MAGLGHSLTLALGLAAPAAIAGAGNPCLQAAAEAAARHGIPEAILRTIAQAESGIGPGRAPWPWTLGQGGQGQRYDRKDHALAALRALLADGRTNLDIGCFQINYRWHAPAFATLEEMIAPARNADHAARFLSELHRETGNWRDAAGAYHSRHAAHAARYIRRLEQIHAENRAAASAGSGAPPHRGLQPPPSRPAATGYDAGSRPARGRADTRSPQPHGPRSAGAPSASPEALSLAPRPPLAFRARPPVDIGGGA